MRLLTILFISVLCFSSCKDDDPILPGCISDKLDLFKPEACPGTGTGLNAGNLTTFRFRQEVVYCFLWGDCDPEKTIEIYDAECNLICEMRIDYDPEDNNGNPQGCNGTVWAGNAEQLDEIWANR